MLRVYGHVKKPGWLYVTPPLTVAHAIELAGGLRYPDIRPEARVLRADGQELKSLDYSLSVQEGDRLLVYYYIP